VLVDVADAAGSGGGVYASPLAAVWHEVAALDAAAVRLVPPSPDAAFSGAAAGATAAVPLPPRASFVRARSRYAGDAAASADAAIELPSAPLFITPTPAAHTTP